MYSTVASDLRSIAGEASEYMDDVESFILTKKRNGNGNVDGAPLTFHKTSLNYAGKGYNGKADVNNGNANDTSIWWFINTAGYKEYKVGKGNAYGSYGGMLQEVPRYVNNKETNKEGYADMADQTYTYFKATDGNTYQVTYYKDSPKGTTITKYTGDTTNITYVAPDYSGYPTGGPRH